MDYLVNLFPIILLLLTVLTLFNSSVIEEIALRCFGIYHFLFIVLALLGYGNTIMVITGCVEVLLYCLFWTCVCIKYDREINRLSYILFYIFMVLFELFFIYMRLHIAIEIIEAIQELGTSIQQYLFFNILENDWFKGISIGILSTVFGGLILNKILNMKNKDRDGK